MSTSEFEAEPRLRVGELRRPHGLSGEISVDVVGDFPGVIAPGVRLWWKRGEDARPVVIDAVRANGKRLLVRFQGSETLDAARDLCGGSLSIARSEIRLPSPDFIFDDEIVGFECRLASGASIGTAAGFERHGQAVYVRIADGERVSLVPFTFPIVRSVSREQRTIVLDPPEGLFEL